MSRGTARTVVSIDFGTARPQRPTVAATRRVPRVARLLALAHRIDRKIGAGELKDLADAARRLGLTRARVTQITNLLLLAPGIQEAILDSPPVTSGRDPISERQLRPIVAEPDWGKQLTAWRTIDGVATFLQDGDGTGVLRQDDARARAGD